MKGKKIQLVVFDWAGTTVDYGSMAPATVFERTFAEKGIRFTREEINIPMGMEKKDHIRALLQSLNGGSQWKTVYGREFTEADVEEIYALFEKNLGLVVAEYSKPIDGVVETVNRLKQDGVKIGSTTGYTSEIMEHVLPGAKAAGYEPDCLITPDQVGYARPTPFMVYACMAKFGIYPPSAVVKVGDTVMDILEGKNAGCWTVGILTGSNLVGLSEAEYRAASREAIEVRKEKARRAYLEAGADFVVDSIRELPAVIQKIDGQEQ